MNEKQTRKSYRQVLKPLCVKTLNEQGNAIVYLDNAPGHVAVATRQYLKQLNIESLGFGGIPVNDEGGVPPNSPDLSAIEYLFGIWRENVAKRCPTTTEQLI